MHWPLRFRRRCQPTKPADQDLPAPIKVDVDVVNILASVRDQHGALVPNLEKQDFTILEDGKPQNIKYFTGKRISR